MGANEKNLVVKGSPLAAMSERLGIDSGELESVIKATVMPAKDANKNALIVTNEIFVSFLAVANAYGLDPLKKEIFAFPAKGGGIQPVVSIDGWLTIINAHPSFDGMELVENYAADGGQFESVTATIHRSDREHPTVITEDLKECKRNTVPWEKPKRMLRHKAVIQCARYAFGLGGIVEADEAEAALGGEVDITPAGAAEVVVEAYPAEKFAANLPKWRGLIESGKKTPADIIATVESKGSLTEAQKIEIENCEPLEAVASEVGGDS